MTSPIMIPSDRNDWNKRPQDKSEQIETYRKLYFLCEGEVTEYYYFHGLKNNRKSLNINTAIEINVFEKTDKDKGASAREH